MINKSKKIEKKKANHFRENKLESCHFAVRAHIADSF